MPQRPTTIPFSITKFTGGMTNDPRSTREGLAQAVTNLDIFTSPRRMVPYRDSESGDSSASTSQKQAFLVALRTGSTYKLYGLGVVSGTARAEVLMKNLTTGASDDLDDATWETPTNHQSPAGATDFNLFIYYAKTGFIYGARAGSHIWRFDPSSSVAWADSHQALTYGRVAQGLVHSQDDILYIPYDNKIAKNDNGTWTTSALTIPSHYYISSIAEHGKYIAIAAAPLSGVGSSRVYLWDRDTTLTLVDDNIDWGEGVLKVLESVEGHLIGVSVAADATRTRYRVIFRSYAGYGAVRFEEFTSTTSPVLLQVKQKMDNRIYFLMAATINGTLREGLWSIGRASPSDSFAIAHERTPNNDTALGNGTLKGFSLVGDYAFISYVNNSSDYALSKTNDTASYTAKSIYESPIINGDDSSILKNLVGVSVTYEPLGSSGQVELYYRKDEETSWTKIHTETTDNAISHSSSTNESANEALPNFKEIAFRIESTGGAVITGLHGVYELTESRNYGE